MQHSDAPFVELERARRAAEAMRQTQSLEDLEEQWKEYLRRLERVWNKAETTSERVRNGIAGMVVSNAAHERPAARLFDQRTRGRRAYGQRDY